MTGSRRGITRKMRSCPDPGPTLGMYKHCKLMACQGWEPRLVEECWHLDLGLVPLSDIHSLFSHLLAPCSCAMARMGVRGVPSCIPCQEATYSS